MQGIFQHILPLVLASSSPRRQYFLQELGVDFTIICPKGAEPSPIPHEDPADYAARAALVKARTAAQHTAEDTVIIAADTVVDVDGEILGKPTDTHHALHMLRKLSGRKHRVVSAVSVIFPHKKEHSFYDCADVFFHKWSESILAAYAAHKEGRDKAGAYAIQGKGAFLVNRIEGSWTTVVGMPLSPLVELLLAHGAITLRNHECPKPPHTSPM